MSDPVALTVDAADFSHCTVIDLATVKAEPATIAKAALASSRGGVGHVFVHPREDGAVTWQPTWRPFGVGEPRMPVGFPETQMGFGRDMASVIDRKQYRSSVHWPFAQVPGAGHAIVFDSAEDAEEFVAKMADAARFEADRPFRMGGGA